MDGLGTCDLSAALQKFISERWKETEKRGVGQEWEQHKKKRKKSERSFMSQKMSFINVCALQQLTLKCIKSWLFASNSVSLFEGFTGL